MDLVRPWAAALALWVVGAVAGHRIIISYAELETLKTLGGHLAWEMPVKFVLMLLVALTAALLHGRTRGTRSRRHLIAVFAVPALVVVQDTVFLILDEGPDYLFWALRELATIAGALSGWMLGRVIRRR